MDAVVDLMALPYRRSVGILVFNHEGKVWVGRRLMVCTYEDTEISHRWQLPQGGIDENEEPLDAARRELYEETGIRSVELIKEAKGWFHYDFPQKLIGSVLNSKYRGQIQKWFAFQFTGELSEIATNPPPNGHKAEFDQWQWVDLETLPSIVIPFKKRVYMRIVNEFRGSLRGL